MMNRRLNFEPLEDRTTPTVTFSYTGTILNFNMSEANDTLTIAALRPGLVKFVAFDGTGLPQQAAAQPVTGISITDTSGGSSNNQTVRFEDFIAPGGPIIYTDLISVTGVETVNFDGVWSLMAHGGLTISNAVRVRQAMDFAAVELTDGVLSIQTTGTGDAIGTSAKPLRVNNMNSGGLVANTVSGGGEQWYDFGGGFLNVSGTVEGPVRANFGTVTVRNGTLYGLSGSDFGDATTFNLETGGVLSVFDTERIGGLTGTGLVASDGGAILEVGANNVSSSFAGTITDLIPDPLEQGTLQLRKIGSGNFTFTGAASHTGGTEVAEGRLILDGSLSGSVTVAATASLGGSGTSPGSLTLQANGAALPGTTTATGTLTVGNTLFETGSVFGVKVNSDSDHDRLQVNGTVAINPNAFLFVPPTGSVLDPNNPIVILGNNGTDPIQGRFANAPQGALVPGTPYRIDYFGGTGNDITLTLVNERITLGGSLDGRMRRFSSDASGTLSPSGTAAPFGAVPANVRVAGGDVNGDGVDDIVLATGPGTPIRLAVVNGKDGSTLVAPFDPFGGDFTGGGFVAAADFDGDGRAEFIVTPDRGGGPRVSIFSFDGSATQLRANFFGIDDANFRGGARVAAGDINGDGAADLAVVAGFGGGPRVSLINGVSVLQNSTSRMIPDFFAFEETLRNGTYLAIGDVNGDRFGDLVFGAGPGGSPRVLTLNGGRLLFNGLGDALANPLANFFVAGNESDRGGVRVAAAYYDGDARAEVIVGSGEGSASRARAYLGKNFGGGEPAIFQDLDPFNSTVFEDGIYVG